MNMLAGLMGGLVNTEQITRDTIQSTLENVAEELGCTHKELFIKISADGEGFNPTFHIFQTEPYTTLDLIPRWKFIREIKLKEILSDE